MVLRVFFCILGRPVGVCHDRDFQYARFASSIGLPASAGGHVVIRKLIETKKDKPVPRIRVQSAPLQEHKIFGDDIDLLKLSVPNHERDGERYLLTYGLPSEQVPDGKWLNWAITRCMLIRTRQLAGVVGVKQDIGVIWDMWKAQGKHTPWAYAPGMPLAVVIADFQEQIAV
jgi:phenacrylate decarboxylase